MTTTFVDLFSGGGGLSYGLKLAGLEPIAAYDTNADAIKIYNDNIGQHGFVDDVKKIYFKKHFADIVVGGLPCQGFSTLGKRDIYDERNYLWKAFLRVIKEISPIALMTENVPQFFQSFHFKQFKAAISNLGYKTNFAVLNAVNYGVPQNRTRAIFICSKKRKPMLPKQENKILTVRDAIGDLPRIPDGINSHTARNPTKLSIERYKHIPEGGNRSNLPKELQSKCWLKLGRRGASNVFGRLWWDKPSPTIRTTFIQPECGRYLHPEANRPITIREGARLQSFPDSFTFNINSSRSKATIIGNSVPIQLAKHLGETILSSI